MKTQEELLDIAHDARLTKIEITTGSNGYPQGLGDYGVIGFENYQQAEEFITDNGGEMAHFKSRDGWNFWENRGAAYGPLSSDNYLADLGNNYRTTDSKDIIDTVNDILSDLATKFDGNFEEIEGFIALQKEIQIKIDEAREDEDVILTNGEYFETVKKETMQYHEDVWTYAVGVFVSRDLNNY